MGRAVMRDLQNSIVTTQQQQHPAQQQQQGHHMEQRQQAPQQEHGAQHSTSLQQAWTAVQLPDSPSDAVILVESPQTTQPAVTDPKQPLLQPSSPVKAAAAGSLSVQPCCAGIRELNVLLRLALPTIVTTAAQQIIIVTSQMFSGHIGTDEMAAAALSNTWWNLMWYILLGVSTALDTLGSQAVGAGDKEGLVVWSMTAAVILTLINIPMGAGIWYGDWVAQHLFGQGPEVVVLVKQFCRWLLPGLWPMVRKHGCCVLGASEQQQLLVVCMVVPSCSWVWHQCLLMWQRTVLPGIRRRNTLCRVSTL
eukprot:GHUV01044253.1.p1 GENE.GHUV01044253.1~~GHUV01044253.1.p1  ORF type:complete len:307 (+),score=86.41 GHUV01044253.1:179-1099(+)